MEVQAKNARGTKREIRTKRRRNQQLAVALLRDSARRAAERRAVLGKGRHHYHSLIPEGRIWRAVRIQAQDPEVAVSSGENDLAVSLDQKGEEWGDGRDGSGRHAIRAKPIVNGAIRLIANERARPWE